MPIFSHAGQVGLKAAGQLRNCRLPVLYGHVLGSDSGEEVASLPLASHCRRLSWRLGAGGCCLGVPPSARRASHFRTGIGREPVRPSTSQTGPAAAGRQALVPRQSVVGTADNLAHGWPNLATAPLPELRTTLLCSPSPLLGALWSTMRRHRVRARAPISGAWRRQADTQKFTFQSRKQAHTSAAP